jgi:hypothetical protein
MPASLARPAASASAAPAETSALARQAGSIVTIVSQRVIEVWDSGDGKRQISERHFWRRTEE